MKDITGRELKLIKPQLAYKDDFVKNINDYKINGENLYFDMYKGALSDFENFVNTLEKHSKGDELPEGWTIPYTTYWLVNNLKHVLGIIRIRKKKLSIHGHIGYDIPPRYRQQGYGSKLLHLALKEIEQLGVNDIIITCSKDNIYSKKIIEKNNCIFLKEVKDQDNCIYHQYSIRF